MSRALAGVHHPGGRGLAPMNSSWWCLVLQHTFLRFPGACSYRCSLGRRNWQVRAHHTGATWHSPLAVSSRENTVQDCCSDIWLCPRRWSRLFQASCPSSLRSVMSVTPFCQPRRLVRFAGKHVHRSPKFFYRGSCCLERTSTRPMLTAHQSPTVPIRAETHLFRQAYNTAWFLWEQFAEEWNFVIVIVIVIVVVADLTEPKRLERDTAAILSAND